LRFEIVEIKVVVIKRVRIEVKRWVLRIAFGLKVGWRVVLRHDVSTPRWNVPEGR